jgi:hypothetical protein
MKSKKAMKQTYQNGMKKIKPKLKFQDHLQLD